MNHSQSMRNVHPPLQRSTSLWSRVRSWLVDDATWEPTYNSLVAAVLAVWITAFLIGIAAWAQSYAASQSSPQAVGSTHADVEAVSSFIGDVR